MKFSTLAAYLALPLAVGGCASFPMTTGYLDELKVTAPSGSAFTQALSREYAAFAESERQQYDWWNSQVFAHKGLDAARGVMVTPEPLEDWSFADKKAASELVVQRDRLMKVLATNAPMRLPVLTATAQVKFDCWVEQQNEGWQVEDIAACRNDFMAALDAIEAQAKAPPAPVAKAETAQRFQLFFDFNKSKLTPEAANAVTDIAKAAKKAGFPAIRLAGFTDLSGPDAYNVKLSMRRAQAVKKALIAAGVPDDKITVEGLGKANPLVPTAGGVREPQNRRVEVTFGG